MKFENKILDGKLHSQKHNLKFKSITPKGNPVVSKECDDTGCELIQHSEVEKNELVLSKPVTLTIEKYRKKYKETEDESILIALGNYVKEQLLTNTEDSKDKLLK